MATSPIAGNRQNRARSPRDITGKAYQRQQAEQKAKRDAEDNPPDLAAIRHDSWTRGHARGYESGFTAGWDTWSKRAFWSPTSTTPGRRIRSWPGT
jgi:hypothetical protein